MKSNLLNLIMSSEMHEKMHKLQMLKGMLSHGTGYKFEIDQVFSSSRNSVITFTLKEDFMKFPVQ